MTNAVADVVMQKAAESHDPWFVGLAFVLGIVILLVSISKPIMGLVKEYKRNGADNAKAEAEASLYEQLQDQIRANTNAITVLIREKDEWFRKAVTLEHEVERLKTFEKMVESMKKRLDDKDLVITEREIEIRRLMTVIIEMKDQLHALELRVTRDEEKVCNGCVYRRNDPPLSGQLK
jgi:predicted RNase H-like nuclease (RuvC/YqgF family)